MLVFEVGRTFVAIFQLIQFLPLQHGLLFAEDVLQDCFADIQQLQIHCPSYWANCGGVYVGIRVREKSGM